MTTRGPVEAAMLAEGERIDQLRLEPINEAMTMVLANQLVLAKALDEMGRALALNWEDIEL